MGEKVVAGRFDLSDRQRYREKLRDCLAGLERLLVEKRFDRPKNLMGVEIELNLAGSDGMPRMLNGQVLERIASRDFQTELAMFNLEVNIAPHRLGGRVFDRLDEELRTSLAYADRKAREVAAGIVMIGILPTLERDDLVSANLSEVDRYTLLNDQIVAARGEDFVLDIEGVEHLRCTSKSIVPEAACTSVQLHLQVTPARFADVWNAAQAASAVQIAVGANSPFLFGHELWRESRPPLFLQATENGAMDRSGLAKTADQKGIETLNLVVIGMVVLFAAIMLVNTLVAATVHRRREFGQARLAGATPAQVLGTVALESAVLTVVGVACGTVASVFTIIPFAVARKGSAVPDGSAWIYAGVVALAAALTAITALAAARRTLRTPAVDAVTA